MSKRSYREVGIVALGAGAGLVFGAAFGNPGVGLVIGAAAAIVISWRIP